jgi:tRNA-2-methylthio-N6-dimethylallyladenosine synthase
VRGRERSKPRGDILEEITRLVGLGVREVTLLGQNVNSYRDGNLDFAGLLQLADGIEGLRRLRFTTSHPKDLTKPVLECMRDLPRVCENLHLPLQSGSDRVLELMNRSYTSEDYGRLVDLARSTVPGLAVTTDLMVGFPTETIADHEATLKAMETSAFEAAFMFRYSERPGTAASKLKDDVPDKEKTRRLQEVLSLQNQITDSKKQALVGKTVEILIERASERDAGFMTGRTRKNWLAKLPEKGVRKGEVVMAEVTGVSRWMVTCDRAVRKVGA